MGAMLSTPPCGRQVDRCTAHLDDRTFARSQSGNDHRGDLRRARTPAQPWNLSIAMRVASRPVVGNALRLRRLVSFAERERAAGWLPGRGGEHLDWIGRVRDAERQFGPFGGREVAQHLFGGVHAAGWATDSYAYP